MRYFETHVLLVEDEAPKSWHITNLVREVAPAARVTVARSVVSALDALQEADVSLLLLDMSLPTFDVGQRERGGRPQGFGGVEILRNMMLSEISCPTIIITGYEGFTREDGGTVDLEHLRAELMAEFPSLVTAVLHYNTKYDEWKVVLTEALQAGLRRGLS